MLDHLAYRNAPFPVRDIAWGLISLGGRSRFKFPGHFLPVFPTRASTQGVILYVNLLFFNSRPESATWSITDMGQVSGGPEGHDLTLCRLFATHLVKPAFKMRAFLGRIVELDR